MFMNALLVLIAFGATLGGSQGASPGGQSAEAIVLGTWEGESECMVAGSPCRNEHVIYEITRDEKAGGEKMDGYKVVNGKKDFMGTLQCRYNADKKNLSCGGGNPRMKDDWQYFVSGDTMQGTLVVGEERTLYRKIRLKRKGGKT
jgi:hypothetical protein